MMNASIAYIHSNLSGATWRSHMNKDIAVVYFAAAAVASAILIQAFLASKFTHIRKLFSIFIPTPTKLIIFLILGQAPLRHFGFLDHITLTTVIGVAGFGGLGLSIFYVAHDRFLSVSQSKALEAADSYGNRSKKIKLDRALQEKLTLLLICEIYHTIVGVVIGALAMGYFEYCNIDHKHLDLLMTAGLFGPTIFFILFISLSGIVFGVSWCLRIYRNWWHGY